MKTKINIGLLLLSSCLFSCDDEGFLKENPETFYTIDNIFTTSSQVKQVVTSCYEQVQYIYCPRETWDLGFYAYCLGNGTDMYDVPTIRLGNRFNDYSILNSQTDNYYKVYSAFYQLINIANTALMAADMEHIVWESQEEKAKSVAEARFFRAFAYRNLGELFGGVPLVTEVATEPRYDYARSSRLDTYQYAIDELEGSLNDLPETTAEAGRLVRAAALHNLCQLYIDKGVVLEESGSGEAKEAYNKAVDYANQVIDSGVYHLMTARFGSKATEDPIFYYATAPGDQTAEHSYAAAGQKIKGNVFWDLFQMGNQDYQLGNQESIWTIQMDYEVYKQEGSKGTIYGGYYCPVFRDQGGDLATGSMEDVGGLGTCAIQPTFYTRDLIYSDKFADDMRNSDAVFRRTIIGNVPGSEYYGKVIPWSVLYREDANGKKADPAATLLYPLSCKIAPDYYVGIEDGQNRNNLFRDHYMIRLPETILLRAEAKLRLGNAQGAADDINIIRDRAQCGYRVNAADMTIDLILDERARELVYEESRWNTLLRMGGTVAMDRIKKYAYWDYPRTTLNKNFNLWPIPQTVIDVNKDVKMEQNPGWN